MEPPVYPPLPHAAAAERPVSLPSAPVAPPPPTLHDLLRRHQVAAMALAFGLGIGLGVWIRR